MAKLPRSLAPLLRDCLTTQSQEDWEEFVRRLQPTIAGATVKTWYQYAGRRPEPELIDDLVQQVYLRLCGEDYRALRRFECRDNGEGGDRALLAYVRMTACNLTIDHLRTGTPAFEELDAAMPAPGGGFTGEIELTATVDRHLEICSGGNAERDRRIFWLYYRNVITARGISEIPHFGLTQKGVEALIFRLSRCIRSAILEGIRRPLSFHKKGGDDGTTV